MKPMLYTQQILATNKVAENTYTYWIEKPSNFEFKAGQYIRVILYDKKTGEKHSRYFTISSSPQDNTLSITFKIKDSLFKELILGLRIYDNIQFFGAIGEFYIDASATGECVFISHGVGITPFISMLRYIWQEDITVTPFLFASFRSKEFVLHKFKKEMHRYFTDKKEFQSLFLLHSEGNRIGYLTLEKYIADLTKPTYYLCGSENFVKGMKAILLSVKGIEEDKIKHEAFI